MSDLEKKQNTTIKDLSAENNLFKTLFIVLFVFTLFSFVVLRRDYSISDVLENHVKRIDQLTDEFVKLQTKDIPVLYARISELENALNVTGPVGVKVVFSNNGWLHCHGQHCEPDFAILKEDGTIDENNSHQMATFEYDRDCQSCP